MAFDAMVVLILNKFAFSNNLRGQKNEGRAQDESHGRKQTLFNIQYVDVQHLISTGRTEGGMEHPK